MRWANAAALYDGPFLDGFYLTGAPEFERWVEAERATLTVAPDTATSGITRAQVQLTAPRAAACGGGAAIINRVGSSSGELADTQSLPGPLGAPKIVLHLLAHPAFGRGVKGD